MTVQCPEGGPAILQQCREKEYESYVKTTNVSFKTSIDVLNKVNISGFDAGVKNQITELRQKLDNNSSILQDIIKASMDAYYTTPCDRDVRKSHTDLIKNIAKQIAELKQLQNEIGDGKDENRVKMALNNYETNNNEKAIFGRNYTNSNSDKNNFQITLTNPALKDTILNWNNSVIKKWMSQPNPDGCEPFNKIFSYNLSGTVTNALEGSKIKLWVKVTGRNYEQTTNKINNGSWKGTICMKNEPDISKTIIIELLDKANNILYTKSYLIEP
jgi:hypothetical protein